MAKLYPPHIEGALPAFCGNTLIIPFEHSRAVSPKTEITGYHYILKDIQQSKIVGGDGIPVAAAEQDSAGNWEINCTGINTTSLAPGTFYKLQLAYIDKAGATGYFSDVGIIKYIKEPTVKIVGLSQTGLNNHQYNYQLQYNCQDSTEKLYSTKFILAQDSYDNPIASSDEIIHNTNNDTQYEGTENYEFLQELDPKKSYWIYAIITTTSGYKKITPYYPLTATVGIPDYINGWKLTTDLDFDNGCISIYMTSQLTSTASGTFKLVRADEKESFSIWHSLVEINLSAKNITENNPYLLWRDFTIEQGYTYKYAMMQKNNNNKYSAKQESGTVYADFEDSFLFDGDRQLRIRFDPKISSFKTTVQETKTDTIGGRYPFIQRNGDIYYKEFPISGLISHLSDPTGYFAADIANLKEIDNETVATDASDSWDGFNYNTDLNSKNIQLERRFKMEVLDWLNNGKPKLFRSPTEGNYLVRLLGSSLSPVDTLGRMLHNFSCNAYEIDEATSEKLKEHNIIKDYYLAGRNNYDFDKNFISYYVSNLEDGRNLLEKQSELRNKVITGAAFSIQPSYNKDVWVNINDKDIKVSDRENAIYNDEITSLKSPTSHTFQYSTPDLITLSYRNVLSADAFNNIIEDILSQVDITQYYGFNYQNLFGDIKLFLQKIYKMICSVRPIIIAAYNLTREVLQDVFTLLGFDIHLDDNNWISKLYDLGANKLKEVIKYFCGDNCIAAAAYKFLDATGKVIGYVDGQKCTWLKQADQYITGAAKAVINLLYGSSDSVTVTLQNSETKTFTADDLGETLTNIIANPFTCIDIIYKTGVNVFERVVGTSTFNTTQTTSSQSTLGNYINTAVSISGSLLNSCENLYNTYVNNFKDGSIPDSGVSGATNTENTTNINNILNQAAATTAQLINSAAEVLTNNPGGGTSGNTSSSSKSITEVAASTITTIVSAFRGLFGGLC